MNTHLDSVIPAALSEGREGPREEGEDCDTNNLPSSLAAAAYLYDVSRLAFLLLSLRLPCRISELQIETGYGSELTCLREVSLRKRIDFASPEYLIPCDKEKPPRHDTSQSRTRTSCEAYHSEHRSGDDRLSGSRIVD